MAIARLQDKLDGCFILGGCGDALGAPIETVKTLTAIFNTYGGPLADIIEFKNAYEEGVDYPAGRITDDTTMAMTTAAALILARREKLPEDPAFLDTLRNYTWQGYLNWGGKQDNGPEIAGKIDALIKWPNATADFWFHCGAGRNTIASLMQDAPGTIEKPQKYKVTVRGKETKSPNFGCGGMMRIAPIAFIDGFTPEQIFEAACDNAAITHGHPQAYVATGIIALYVHFAANDFDGVEILQKTRDVLNAYATRDGYKDGIPRCLDALKRAEDVAASGPIDAVAIDMLPLDLGFKNAFLATPVLAQATFAMLAAKTADDVKSSIVLAANHSGDSDSVAAIVGNILGARFGMKGVPAEWSEMLLQKQGIADMAVTLHGALITMRKPERSPKFTP